jgi:serine/threonine protein kinase
MQGLGNDDPRVIGEYRLQACLGSGGMGRVYLGLSPAGRAVAVKVLHPGLRREFRHEADDDWDKVLGLTFLNGVLDCYT